MTEDDKVTGVSNSENAIDVAACVAYYVELRDKKAELNAKLKEDLKPYHQGMEHLEAILLKHLQNTKAKSVATSAGTVYQHVEYSATIKDKLAFREYVVGNALFDLIDWRANKVQVREHIEKTQADVPGVNTSAFMTIGVRRAGSTQEDE